MTMNAEAVEAAARATYEANRREAADIGITCPTWGALDECDRTQYMHQAEIHLNAAMPFLKAQILRDAATIAAEGGH